MSLIMHLDQSLTNITLGKPSNFSLFSRHTKQSLAATLCLHGYREQTASLIRPNIILILANYFSMYTTEKRPVKKNQNNYRAKILLRAKTLVYETRPCIRVTFQWAILTELGMKLSCRDATRCDGQKDWLWCHTAWVQILPLPPTRCVSLGELFEYSGLSVFLSKTGIPVALKLPKFDG